MLERRHLPLLSPQRYRDIFGFPVRNFYRKAGFHLEQENWDEMAKEFHRNFLASNTLRLHHGTKETLDFFRKQKIGQSILSASEQSILNRMLHSFGIETFFSHVCGVDNLYGISKLNLGKSLIHELQVPAREILFIGDTLHDAEVSNALGTACILVAAGHQSFERLSATRLPVLHHLEDIPQKLL